jgi:hypothetical protein
MASIRAVTEAIAGEAVRLDALAPQLQETAGAINATSDAAADTAAAGACANFTRALSSAVAGYAGVEASLANAVVLAAECYALADNVSIPENAGK